MNGLNLGRFALYVCTAAVLFTGCTGSQPVLVPSFESAASRQLPAANGDILYASAAAGNYVYEFSYPLGGAIGKLAPPSGTIALQGLCSDKYGDFFITAVHGAPKGSEKSGFVYEYQHGGTHPFALWKFEGVAPFGCSYDSASGNLAITTVSLGVTAGALFVESTNSHGSGIYYDYNISNFYYCGYDNKGNLFVVGQGAGTQMQLAELRKGARSLTDIALQKSISLSGMGEVQWDGHYITIEDLTAGAIYRLRISGSKATVAGTTHLNNWNGPTLSWIEGSTVLIPTGIGDSTLAAWRYPAGGKPIKTAKGSSAMFGVTVSVAP